MQKCFAGKQREFGVAQSTPKQRYRMKLRRKRTVDDQCSGWMHFAKFVEMEKKVDS